MAITIAQIKELREATAAGMGACKEALTATNGDMNEAIKYLREKGLAVAAKRVDKESKQGIIALATAADGKSMALAEVNCETDFVANTDAYKEFCANAVKVALEGKNIEETLADDYKMLLTKTGENVKIRRQERYVLEGAGVLSGYIHMGGKIGVLVEFELGNAATAQNDEFKTLAHDVAMQVAATKPLCAVREDMNPEVVEHELAIYREQAAASGKPEAIQEKMAQGRVEKFYKENTLVDQEFVKNPDVTISQYVASVAKAAGDTIAVKGFDIFVLGE